MLRLDGWLGFKCPFKGDETLNNAAFGPRVGLFVHSGLKSNLTMPGCGLRDLGSDRQSPVWALPKEFGAHNRQYPLPRETRPPVLAPAPAEPDARA